MGEWQGYEESNLVAELDLGWTTKVASVSLGCLQDIGSWIFFPDWVEVSHSIDGESWSDPVRVANDVPQDSGGSQLREFAVLLNSPPTRFIRVTAKNIGRCPPWHRGAGGMAWLFADEISITVAQARDDDD